MSNIEIKIDAILQVAKNIQPNVKLIEHHNQYTFSLDSPTDIIDFLRELKQNPETQFDSLLDITAIDWLGSAENKDTSAARFEVVYFLYSNKFKHRVRVKVPVPENLHYPTVTSVYESANWYERETYDMYGIIFDEHPDLRRFYMPEDFFDKETGETFHPLRKDFPVMGYPDALPLPPYPEKTGIDPEW